MSMLATMVRISFFRTLEINQRHAAVQGAFILERNGLSVSKKSGDPVAFSLALTHPLLPSSTVALEVNSPAITMKTSSLAANGGSDIDLELLQGSIPRELSSLGLLLPAPRKMANVDLHSSLRWL